MYKRADTIITRSIAGETLLIPVTQTGVDLQKVYLLNETAAAIWGLLSEPRDVATMVAALAAEYDAPAEVIERGVTAVIEDLLQRAFVTTEPTDG